MSLEQAVDLREVKVDAAFIESQGNRVHIRLEASLQQQAVIDGLAQSLIGAAQEAGLTSIQSQVLLGDINCQSRKMV
ncbi:hypothetical protein D3C78_1733080 [compost metagenome]